MHDREDYEVDSKDSEEDKLFASEGEFTAFASCFVLSDYIQKMTCRDEDEKA